MELSVLEQISKAMRDNRVFYENNNSFNFILAKTIGLKANDSAILFVCFAESTPLARSCG